jgi:hypothetical protein
MRYRRGSKNRVKEIVATGTWSAMHDHHGFACERPVFLSINLVIGKACCAQMATPDKGRVRRLVWARIAWRRCLGVLIHGDDACDLGKQVVASGHVS